MYCITIIFSYKFKIVNKKSHQQQETEPMVETRRLSTCMVLNCTSLKREKDTKKKIEKISIEMKRM